MLPNAGLACPTGCPDGERIVPFGKTVLPFGNTVVVGAAAGVWIEFCRLVVQRLVGVVAINGENQIPHGFILLRKACPPVEGIDVVIGGINLPIDIPIKCRRMNAVAPYRR